MRSTARVLTDNFRLVPLEAQACGTPVVAYRRGGALETVLENVTGVFFDEQTEKALAAAVEKCAATQWDEAAINAHAGRFGIQQFIDGLARSIQACMGA